MSTEQDLALLALQEQTLQFDHFTHQTAWELGCAIKEATAARGGAVTIEITLNEQLIFAYAMQGTTPNNASWIRRKRNVCMHFQKASYAVGLSLKPGMGLAERNGLPIEDYTAAGGCFPIRLKGGTMIGTIAVSGLPQRDDHRLIIEVLATYLNQNLAALQLPPEA